MDENTKLRLLAGLPLGIDGVCKLHPIKLKEIAEIGYNVYNEYISNIIAEVGDFNIPEDVKDVSVWDIIISNFLYGDNIKYKETMINALSLFTKEVVSFSEKYGFFLGDINDSRFINESVFGKIKYYLKVQNCYDDKKEENLGYNIDPKSEKSARLMKRLKEEKEKLEKLSDSNNESLTLSDLISILSSNSSLDIIKIFDLDIYRFNDQFNRMSILNEYKVSIQSILAGADPQKINIKHYISKI